MRQIHLADTKLVNKGAIAELLTAADLMAKGCEVYRAMSHGSSCDLLAVLHGKTFRIEVKMAGMTEAGAYKRNLRLRHGAFDILAVVSPDLRSIAYKGADIWGADVA
jgi:hypothetical protein